MKKSNTYPDNPNGPVVTGGPYHQGFEEGMKQSKETIEPEEKKLSRFIRMRKVVWYGPHPCEECGETIIRSSKETGRVALDAPFDHHYPNFKWCRHRCTKERREVI
jgi:hypothetical protein